MATAVIIVQTMLWIVTVVIRHTPMMMGGLMNVIQEEANTMIMIKNVFAMIIDILIVIRTVM